MFILVALTFAAVLGGASGAVAAARWEIVSAANTTVPAGGQFTVYVAVRNDGDPTDGSQIDLSIDLPDEMTVVSATSIDGVTFDCSSVVPGTSDAFTCTSSDVLDFQVGTTVAVVVDVSPLAVGEPTAASMVSGGGAPESKATVNPTTIAATPPGFGVDAFDGQVVGNAVGDPFTQAGGHPYAISTQILLNTVTDPIEGNVWPVEAMKDLIVDLPPGLIGDPTSLGRCTPQQLLGRFGNPQCPSASQVGIVLVYGNGANVPENAPVFNMTPPEDVPARFAFSFGGTLVTLDASLRSDGDYGLSISSRNAPEPFAVVGTEVTFWGNPSDPAHDAQRWCPDTFVFGCSTASTAPLLRLPTSCPPAGEGLTTGLRVSSWQHPDVFQTASFVSHLAPNFPFPPSERGAPQGPTGCDDVPFDATFSGTPESPALAGEPAGFAFDLSIPQNASDEIAQSDLKKAVVTLPAGVRVSPSSADGLKACSPAQVGLNSTADSACPDGAKLGTLSITTPLLDDPLQGAIYLATPNDNPADTLLGVYLVAKGPGLIIKLFGRVDADPVTGQLTTTFDDNPQTPFSSLHLEFFGGPRAALTLPAKCGTYITHAVLTSWSGKTRTSDSSFTLDKDSNGNACPATQPFAPSFAAGTVNPVAGEHSPFVMTLKRSDQDQELRSLTIDMPQGMLARLKGVPRCPEAQAAAGTCGADSRVGTVTAGAGAGTNPFFVKGSVYLGGEYKGAPFSLSIVVPVVAGPFDLGTLVVRAAIQIDRKTTALRVVSDPIPSILEGITLQTREIRVAVDRDRFFLNPTSCAEKQIEATVGSTEGATANLSSRFQVGECGRLGLRPRMSLRIGGKGHTHKGNTTPLVTTLTQGSGQAGLKSVKVTLPLALNARLNVVEKACTPAEFDSGHCEKARTGSAVVVTPLLDEPLRGGAYFVRNRPKGLPDLVIALRGEVDVDLTGKIKIPSDGRLSTVFDAVPDVPFSKFTLSLIAGKRGALGTTVNLCSRRARHAAAHVQFVAQNGKRLSQSKRLVVGGCPRGKRTAR